MVSQRARTLRARHPEIVELEGPDRRTALLVAVLTIGQLGTATWVARVGGWSWLALVPAAFVAHALYGAIHECAHHLVFRRRTSNRLFAIAANLPLGAPFAIGYLWLHIQHHLHGNDSARDPDLPSPWELRVFGDRSIGKLAWLLLNPAVQALRGQQVPLPKDRLRWWLLANGAAQVAFDVAVFVLLGPYALAFLILAFVASTIMPPLGARYVQEHFVIREGQDTNSYYGPLNNIALNIGYHVEHHDFPYVAWSRLPQLHAAAADTYGAMAHHKSWSALWWRWVVDPSIGLSSRIRS